MSFARYFFIYLAVALGLSEPLLYGQFAPAAHLPGTTAIAADSADIVTWAQQVTVSRSWQQIDQPAYGAASVGTPGNILGPADGRVVSLGDGGHATVSFQYPVYDGPGWDFVVFENGFATPDGYFLELAYVEVSSNGVDFVPFPSVSLTPAQSQIDGFGLLEPTHLRNLAGKYVAGYGVPFDLAELMPTEYFDPGQVIQIRIVDVVGNIQPAYARYDSEGHIINDPWPTPFPSSGFDLDAVGVIHEDQISNTFDRKEEQPVGIYPNPARAGAQIMLPQKDISQVVLMDARGALLLHLQPTTADLYLPDALPPGVYWLHAWSTQDHAVHKIIVQ